MIRKGYGIVASILHIKGKWRALIRRKGRPPICKTHPTKAAAMPIEAEAPAGDQGDPVDTTLTDEEFRALVETRARELLTQP